MITSAFLNIFYSIISLMIGWLPSITSTSSFNTGLATASGYISALYSFIPYITTAILAIIAFDLIFEGAYFLFKVIYWVIRRFPTQS
jgi:hypothetical protein